MPCVKENYVGAVALGDKTSVCNVDPGPSEPGSVFRELSQVSTYLDRDREEQTR
jgi:hypothetical protein